MSWARVRERVAKGGKSQERGMVGESRRDRNSSLIGAHSHSGYSKSKQGVRALTEHGDSQFRFSIVLDIAGYPGDRDTCEEDKFSNENLIEVSN